MRSHELIALFDVMPELPGYYSAQATQPPRGANLSQSAKFSTVETKVSQYLNELGGLRRDLWSCTVFNTTKINTIV